MLIGPYVMQIQANLTAAAALGGDSTRSIAEALVVAAEPAVRLAVLEAVAAAADEITAALLDSPGAPSVSVRIDGSDLSIEVRASEAPEQPMEAAPVTDDADNAARISLRLPEALKAQIETAARNNGVSVNTWILRATATALTGSGPHASGRSVGGAGTGHRVTGWING